MSAMSSSTTPSQACHSADSLISHLRETVPMLLQTVVEMLVTDFDIDVSLLRADHCCYRTETLGEYELLTNSLNLSTEAELLVEGMIGGRLISTYQLVDEIRCWDGHVVETIEIPSPKIGSWYPFGIEHFEFVLLKDDGDDEIFTTKNSTGHKSKLEKYTLKHEKATWIMKDINKELNPDVSIKLPSSNGQTMTVKFHLIALEQVISYEIANGFAVAPPLNKIVATWETKLASDIMKSYKVRDDESKPFIVGIVGFPGKLIFGF